MSHLLSTKFGQILLAAGVTCAACGSTPQATTADLDVGETLGQTSHHWGHGGGGSTSTGGAGAPGAGAPGAGAPGAGAPGAGSANGGSTSSNAGAPGAGAPSAPPAAPGAQSAGCGKASATGDFTLSATVGGINRTYEVIVPANYDRTRAVPLTFVMHYVNGTSQNAVAFGLQGAAAAAGNVGVFAFPQGVQQGGSVGWNVNSCQNDDITFFDTMVSRLEADYCIQTSRVFVTGFSYGADMTNTLGCCRGNLIRAIAPASGGLFTSAANCTARTPAFRMTEGNWDPFYSQADFANAAAHAATGNHCSSTLVAVNPAPCKAYTGCDQPVLWCTYDQMGHTFPNNWAAETWSFLASFQ